MVDEHLWTHSAQREESSLLESGHGFAVGGAALGVDVEWWVLPLLSLNLPLLNLLEHGQLALLLISPDSEETLGTHGDLAHA